MITQLNFTDLVKKRTINLSGRFDLRGMNKLRDDDFDVVVKVLKKSKVLERLNLSYNNLTLADGKFTDALANNRTLKYLTLSHNKIGVDGAKNIANALKVNKTIRGLTLWDNEIGDKGAKHIADALKENETLEYIGLAENNIGDEGAKSIAASLYKNQRLHTLYLDGNHIGDDGAMALLEALKWNYDIKSLIISSNRVSNHIKAEIKEVLNEPRVPKHLAEVVASKDETIASKNNLIATKDQELKYKAEVIKGKDEAIEKAKKEIEALKKAMVKKDKQITSLKAAIRAPMEQLMTIIEPVDLIVEESEPSNKRARTEDGTARSNLAVMAEHTNQTLQGVEQERGTAQAAVAAMADQSVVLKDLLDKEKTRYESLLASKDEKIASMASEISSLNKKGESLLTSKDLLIAKLNAAIKILIDNPEDEPPKKRARLPEANENEVEELSTVSGVSTAMTRSQMLAGTTIKLKRENIKNGDIKCPRCSTVVMVAEGCCNIVTCRHHSPEYVYFCIHCTKEGENGSDIVICECPKRNTPETRAEAQRMRNEQSKANPTVVDSPDRKPPASY